MATNGAIEMENLLTELDRTITKLEELGFKFSAALVRIAHLDLQMRIHNISAQEVDLLSFAVNAVEQERFRRTEPQADAESR